jgi:hypothetical protein
VMITRRKSKFLKDLIFVLPQNIFSDDFEDSHLKTLSINLRYIDYERRIIIRLLSWMKVITINLWLQSSLPETNTQLPEINFKN